LPRSPRWAGTSVSIRWTLIRIRMKGYGITLATIRNAVMRSNNDVGGKILEVSDAEYFVRGQGYIRSTRDIGRDRGRNRAERGPCDHSKHRDRGSLGVISAAVPLKRTEKDRSWGGSSSCGTGRMRRRSSTGEAEDRGDHAGLPPGMEIKTAYDRSDITLASIQNVEKHARGRGESSSALSSFSFSFIFGSVLRIIIEIPVAVLIAFICMKAFGITSNIMSLGGIAIAIGVIVDASIVLVENAYRNVGPGAGDQGDVDQGGLH